MISQPLWMPGRSAAYGRRTRSHVDQPRAAPRVVDALPKRQELADELYESLIDESMDPGWERAWSKEIEQHMSDVAADRIELIDAADVHRACAPTPATRGETRPISPGSARRASRPDRTRRDRADRARRCTRRGGPSSDPNRNETISPARSA